MALNIETLRNKAVTTLFGRRMGLDIDEQVIGTKGVKIPYEDATSDTTGTNISGYGMTVVDSSTDDTWLLSNPKPGAFKYIYTGSTSTGIRTIKRADNTFAIRTSAISTATTIVAQGGGLWLELFGLSSALFAIVAKPGSTELAINATT